MHAKAGCCHGMIVDVNGNILQAFGWNTTAECPHEFDLSPGCKIIPCSFDEHDRLHSAIHLYRYDGVSHRIILRETGKEVLKLKKQNPGKAGVKGKGK